MTFENSGWQPNDPARGSPPAPLSEDPRPGEVVIIASDPSHRDPDWAARTTAFLARRWAGKLKRLFLMDLDLHGAGIHEALGATGGEGTTDIFLFGASVQRVAQPVDGGAFYFASSGTPTADPEEVLRHARWDRVIRSFKEIDATLMLHLPLDQAGARTLLSHADRIVLLGRPETSADELLSSLADRVVIALAPPSASTASGDHRASMSTATPDEEHLEEAVVGIADLGPDEPAGRVGGVVDIGDLAPDFEEAVVDIADLAPDGDTELVSIAELAPDGGAEAVDIADLAPDEPVGIAHEPGDGRDVPDRLGVEDPVSDLPLEGADPSSVEEGDLEESLRGAEDPFDEVGEKDRDIFGAFDRQVDLGSPTDFEGPGPVGGEEEASEGGAEDAPADAEEPQPVEFVEIEDLAPDDPVGIPGEPGEKPGIPDEVAGVGDRAPDFPEAEPPDAEVEEDVVPFGATLEELEDAPPADDRTGIEAGGAVDAAASTEDVRVGSDLGVPEEGITGEEAAGEEAAEEEPAHPEDAAAEEAAAEQDAGERIGDFDALEAEEEEAAGLAGFDLGGLEALSEGMEPQGTAGGEAEAEDLEVAFSSEAETPAAFAGPFDDEEEEEGLPEDDRSGTEAEEGEFGGGLVTGADFGQGAPGGEEIWEEEGAYRDGEPEDGIAAEDADAPPTGEPGRPGAAGRGGEPGAEAWERDELEEGEALAAAAAGRDQAVGRPLRLLALLVLVAAGAVGAHWFGWVDVAGLDRLLASVLGPAGTGRAPAVDTSGPQPDSPLQSQVLVVDVYRDARSAGDVALALRERLPGRLFTVAPVQEQGSVSYRLLAGPATTREEAESLRMPLSEVLTREDPDDWGVERAHLAFLIDEVGTLDGARARAEAISGGEVYPYVLRVEYPDGATRYRVYAGAYADNETARAMQGILAQEEINDVTFTERRGEVPE